MQPPKRVEDAARQRIRGAADQIANSLQNVADGNPLGAEWQFDRLLARLQNKAGLSREEAGAIATGVRSLAEDPPSKRRSRLREVDKASGPERVYGGTIDFVGISFLERGWRAAQSVARVAFRDGRAQGSGFMISNRLFITNNHVIGSESDASQLTLEFDYELDPADRVRVATRFELDPQSLFVTDGRDALDFTVVAVGKRVVGARVLQEIGFCSLSDAPDKHALGEVANIIQHPDGRYKEVVLRENRLVSRLDSVLHYVADTEPGSSGSPVFNNEWRVIALHHWGGPWLQKADDSGKPVPREVNEGVRISAIVKELRQRAKSLPTEQRMLVEQALEPSEIGVPTQETKPGPRVMREVDGRITWTVPVEISVGIPALDELNKPMPAPTVMATPLSRDARGAERRIEVDPDYDNRRGYNPAFIPAHRIELPRLTAAQRAIAAANRDAAPGDDPAELKYQHFSIVVNRRRKLAFFTACNIDGETLKEIDRQTGQVKPKIVAGGGDEALPGAEASEQWFHDERLELDDETNQDLYSSQEVPGFPNKQTKAWQNRMFQRGHLVRRADPVWGTEARALRAEADTFHFANCTPQVGFFNTGSAPKDTAKSGGGRLWRAIEDYVLENTAQEQKRASVFTGPILSSKDPAWREQVIAGFQVPLRFWKVVAWATDGRLNALAMIADQGPVLKVMPEALELGEAFQDTSAVEDFLSSIREVERLTQLDFGDELRVADVMAGESLGGVGRTRGLRRVTNVEDIPLLRAEAGKAPRRKHTGRARARRRKR